MLWQSLFFVFAKNVTTKFEKIPRMSRPSLKTFFQEALHSVSHPITCFCFSSWQPDAPPIIPLATVLMPPPCGVNALAMKAAQRLEPQPQSVWIKKTKLKDKLRYHRGMVPNTILVTANGFRKEGKWWLYFLEAIGMAMVSASMMLMYFKRADPQLARDSPQPCWYRCWLQTLKQ